MNRLKKIANWVKENPWEAAFWTMTGLMAVQTLNVTRGIKIINEQNDQIEYANNMFEWIADAIKNGWEMVVLDGNIIDIIPPEEAVSLQA